MTSSFPCGLFGNLLFSFQVSGTFLDILLFNNSVMIGKYTLRFQAFEICRDYHVVYLGDCSIFIL